MLLPWIGPVVTVVGSVETGVRIRSLPCRNYPVRFIRSTALAVLSARWCEHP
ncbi:hypothetical protein GCM10011410_12710 [Hoyosella rhizosphaerae]|uniref:Uncharacterized protein n=1 Tax=Hoyosella rhizosphaerae TaxID=1755582 RepID=A0A916U6J4_9ACTN|nr:hypothetical protein GCM10011410_12710 [Hoyosella rhizosphaerae]